jgi:excisionase family DNA binding protein
MTKELISLPPIEAIRGYTPQHAALYLDISDVTVYKLIRLGKLPSRKLGARRIIPGSELIRFLTGHPPALRGDPIDTGASDAARTKGHAADPNVGRRGVH